MSQWNPTAFSSVEHQLLLQERIHVAVRDLEVSFFQETKPNKLQPLPLVEGVLYIRYASAIKYLVVRIQNCPANIHPLFFQMKGEILNCNPESLRLRPCTDRVVDVAPREWYREIRYEVLKIRLEAHPDHVVQRFFCLREDPPPQQACFPPAHDDEAEQHKRDREQNIDDLGFDFAGI